jgi:circadian clock protein KaiB
VKVVKAHPVPLWNLWLYVAGSTPTSLAAFRNLKRICEEHLAGRYHIQVVDLVKNPELARENQILAMPAVVRKDPSPGRRVLGDLSNTKRVLAALGLPLHELLPFASRPRRIQTAK